MYRFEQNMCFRIRMMFIQFFAFMLYQVIEYIHFLQEKVQMYEGSNQMWYQTPTKLIPWVYSFSYLFACLFLRLYLSLVGFVISGIEL